MQFKMIKLFQLKLLQIS